MITLTVNLPGDKEIDYTFPIFRPRHVIGAPLYCSAVMRACETAMSDHPDWTSMVITLARKP